jgi:hypothetical protein
VALAAGTGSAEARQELLGALLATREKLTLARMVATGQLLGLLDRRVPRSTFSRLAACCRACLPTHMSLGQSVLRSAPSSGWSLTTCLLHALATNLSGAMPSHAGWRGGKRRENNNEEGRHPGVRA